MLGLRVVLDWMSCEATLEEEDRKKAMAGVGDRNREYGCWNGFFFLILFSRGEQLLTLGYF
jgi:hypothetical protein